MRKRSSDPRSSNERLKEYQDTRSPTRNWSESEVDKVTQALAQVKTDIDHHRRGAAASPGSTSKQTSESESDTSSNKIKAYTAKWGVSYVRRWLRNPDLFKESGNHKGTFTFEDHEQQEDFRRELHRLQRFGQRRFGMTSSSVGLDEDVFVYMKGEDNPDHGDGKTDHGDGKTDHSDGRTDQGDGKTDHGDAKTDPGDDENEDGEAHPFDNYLTDADGECGKLSIIFHGQPQRKKQGRRKT